ncbi:MAG TPA: hypothetical protein VEB18_03845 [Candidatus Paceibacterota bacterium]|nr:hypothetical protein [Candidatus Paceibacterota bacterium]
MKIKTFHGEKRWEEFEEWEQTHTAQFEICTIGCWPSERGEPMLYIEYSERARV